METILHTIGTDTINQCTHLINRHDKQTRHLIWSLLDYTKIPIEGHEQVQPILKMLMLLVGQMESESNAYVKASRAVIAIERILAEQAQVLAEHQEINEQVKFELHHLLIEELDRLAYNDGYHS